MAREWPARLSCLRDLKHRLLRLHPGLFLRLETVAYLSLWNLQRPLPLPLFLWVSRGRPPHLFLCGVCICQYLSSHRRVCVWRPKVDGYLHSLFYYIYLFWRVCASVTMQMRRSENNVQEVGSLLPLCFWGWGSVYKPWLANHLAGPPPLFFRQSLSVNWSVINCTRLSGQ